MGRLCSKKLATGRRTSLPKNWVTFSEELKAAAPIVPTDTAQHANYEPLKHRQNPIGRLLATDWVAG
jgi:hypothetical protein